MNSLASITVGIPTYNEEFSIIKCLDSCFAQTRLPNEIIVVASGCTDNTVQKIQEYQKTHPIVNLIIEDQRNGKISAINKILNSTKSELLVHTDGDVILPERTIEKLVHYFEHYNFISAVSGAAEYVENQSHLFYKWAVKTKNIIDLIQIQEFKKGVFFHICGYVFAHRTKYLKSVPFVKGATDATMGSLLRKKGPIIFDPSIYALVKHPNNVRDFIRQKSRIRFGFLSLNQTSPSNRKLISELGFFRKLFSNNKILINIGFLYIGMLYLASWIKAHVLFKENADINKVWEPVISTK